MATAKVDTFRTQPWHHPAPPLSLEGDNCRKLHWLLAWLIHLSLTLISCVLLRVSVSSLLVGQHIDLHA